MEKDEISKIRPQELQELWDDEFDNQLRMMVNRTRWASQAGLDFRVAAYDLPRQLFDSVHDCQDPEPRKVVVTPENPMWMKVVTDHVTIYTREPPIPSSTTAHSEPEKETGSGERENQEPREGEGEEGDHHIVLLRGESLELPLYQQYKFDLDRSCPSCPAKMRRYGDPQDVPGTSEIKVVWECETCETRVIQLLRLEFTSWEPGPRGRVLKAPL